MNMEASLARFSDSNPRVSDFAVAPVPSRNLRRSRSYDDLTAHPAPKIRVTHSHDYVWDRAEVPGVGFDTSAPLSNLVAQYLRDHPTPIRNPRDLKVVSLPNIDEMTESSKLMFTPFANFALNYFNSIENRDFKLVEVTLVGYTICRPMSTIHLNFHAASNSGDSHLFYAELEAPSFNQVDVKGTKVLGCSMLERVDTGNPLGFGCYMCSSKLIHPGPKNGHMVVAGDRFEDASFWNYAPNMGLDSSQIRRQTARYIDMYTACAEKAIKHLNRKLEADWELLKVIAAAERLKKRGRVIHLNFTVQSSNFSVSKLCFAELFLPLFEDDSDAWIVEKEPFLEVSGCCIMEKDVNYESRSRSFRVCGVCNEVLIHPGPRYGYHEVAGDVFDGYDFKRESTGYFLE